MNTVLNAMKNDANYKLTEKGGVALKSTLNEVYDMFALCGAYRTRTEDDCIFMFKKAFEEDRTLALKCLFYLADCRGGQGERRFFRVCFKWLAKNYPEIAKKNLELIPIYRRWDDVLYSCVGTPIENDALAFIKSALAMDVTCEVPSLLAKWLPSENASSRATKKMGTLVRNYLGVSHKEYRKMLSVLRSRINIVEKLMSQGKWDEIQFDKIPSRAGLIYKNAFARHDVERYKTFAEDKTTTVNAGVLYPYEVVAKAVNGCSHYRWNGGKINLSDTDRAMLDKYWKNLPDYFEGKQSDMLCVVDTSGSMTGSEASAPINVAISLGMYAAERAGGPFKDHYISFSHRPQLIKVEGIDFADKVARIYKTNLCEDTNLVAVFDMLLEIADRPTTKEEDIPGTIVVISDMEIDAGSDWHHRWTTRTAATEMQRIRDKWASHGHKLPRLVYWNVDARQNTILDAGPAVSFVSGMSPSLFKQVITGKNGMDLMLDALNNKRYAAISA